jgi:hypothetical protein
VQLQDCASSTVSFSPAEYHLVALSTKLRRCGRAQHRRDESRLAVRIRYPIIWVSRREPLFQRSVLIAQLHIGEEDVAKREMAAQFGCALGHNIEVMPRLASWPLECLPAGNFEIPLMNVADPGQEANRPPQYPPRWQRQHQDQ